MLYLNNACSEKSNIKIILKRAMWRKRAKNYLKHMELDKKAAEFIILDAPTGFGKTHAIRELLSSKPEGTVNVMSCEMVIEILLHYISNSLIDENQLINYIGNSKCLVVEDVDVDLVGKEATQEEVANALAKTLNGGITVIVTGINIKNNLPYFYKKLTSQLTCPVVELKPLK